MYDNITLQKWQQLDKPINRFIVQPSAIDGSDSICPYPIGYCYNIVNYVKKNKNTLPLIGNHEKNVLCAIVFTTDIRRRGNNTVNRYNILKNLEKNNIKNELLNYKKYYEGLPNYKFIISPEGNGIDCHRHYEALMAGCIPILEHNTHIKEKYKDLPILYTTDYSEITHEYLECKYNEMFHQTYNFNKLFIDYYTKQQQAQIKFNGNFWCYKLTRLNWY
jgi:hypothetical protein